MALFNRWFIKVKSPEVSTKQIRLRVKFGQLLRCPSGWEKGKEICIAWVSIKGSSIIEHPTNLACRGGGNVSRWRMMRDLSQLHTSQTQTLEKVAEKPDR